MVLYTEVANGYEGLDLRSYEVLAIANCVCALKGGGDVTLRRVANLLRLLALQLWWEKH